MDLDKSKNRKNDLKKQRKEAMRTKREEIYAKIFGVNRGEYIGNIWGWRFSILSLIGLLIIGGIAIFGIVTNRIDWKEQLYERPSDTITKQHSKVNQTDKSTFRDSLKMQ